MFERLSSEVDVVFSAGHGVDRCLGVVDQTDCRVCCGDGCTHCDHFLFKSELVSFFLSGWEESIPSRDTPPGPDIAWYAQHPLDTVPQTPSTRG